MNKSASQSAGPDGQHQVTLPRQVIETAIRERPLLRGLLTVGAGYWAKGAQRVCRRPEGGSEAVFIYCVKGAGWCEVGRQLHAMRAGDLAVVPPLAPHAYGAHASNPWTIHWAQAIGENLRDYLQELGVSAEAPLVRVGENLQLTRLFNEMVQALERGVSFGNVLQASHTLAHVLAMIIGHRQEQSGEVSDNVQRVAQSIIYMSEHLDQPLRVSALAGMANLSQAHFAALFKEQTGCSPRDYLQLLRFHRACELLRSSELNVKEIAGRLGYQDQFHFSRQFKAFQGVSPSEYREARG